MLSFSFPNGANNEFKSGHLNRQKMFVDNVFDYETFQFVIFSLLRFQPFQFFKVGFVPFSFFGIDCIFNFAIKNYSSNVNNFTC